MQHIQNCTGRLFVPMAKVLFLASLSLTFSLRSIYFMFWLLFCFVYSAIATAAAARTYNERLIEHPCVVYIFVCCNTNIETRTGIDKLQKITHFMTKKWTKWM